MIRQYRQFMMKVLLTLVWCEANGFEGNEILRWARNRRERTTNKTLDFALDNSVENLRIEREEGIEFNVMHMAEELAEQIMNEDNEGDVPLIEMVGRILDRPFVINHFNREMIDLLKKTLLIPSEIATLDKRLEEAELHCSECDSKLVTGELVTLNTRNNIARVKCMNCTIPNYMKAANGDLIDIPMEIRRSLGDAMGDPVEGGEAAAPTPTVQPAEPIRVGRDEIGRQQRELADTLRQFRNLANPFGIQQAQAANTTTTGTGGATTGEPRVATIPWNVPTINDGWLRDAFNPDALQQPRAAGPEPVFYLDEEEHHYVIDDDIEPLDDDLIEEDEPF